MHRIHQYGMMSAPTISQVAAVEALKHADADVRRMVASYNQRRRIIVDGFRSIGFSCFEPGGAFYCFPNITTTGLDDEAFAQALLDEEKVALVPGRAFGASGTGHVRCCYAVSLDNIQEALVRIGRFVDKRRMQIG
jgi:aminotransferase